MLTLHLRLGESKSNEMEALLVKNHVENLVDAGVKEEDIAVITPYNAQVCSLSFQVFLLLQLSLRSSISGADKFIYSSYQPRGYLESIEYSCSSKHRLISFSMQYHISIAIAISSTVQYQELRAKEANHNET
jgi:hypothetical protein